MVYDFRESNTTWENDIQVMQLHFQTQLHECFILSQFIVYASHKGNNFQNDLKHLTQFQTADGVKII